MVTELILPDIVRSADHCRYIRVLSVMLFSATCKWEAFWHDCESIANSAELGFKCGTVVTHSPLYENLGVSVPLK